MAISIVEELRAKGSIEEESLFQAFAARYEPMRGYGRSAQQLFAAAHRGATWEEAAKTLYRGMGSFGNGASMRVAPLGAYFADDAARCSEQPRVR